MHIKVTQLCYLLDAILKRKDDNHIEVLENISLANHKSSLESVESVQNADEMEAIFISSLYYSLGAPLESNSRLVFDEFVKKLSGLIKIDDTPIRRATYSKIIFLRLIHFW